MQYHNTRTRTRTRTTLTINEGWRKNYMKTLKSRSFDGHGCVKFNSVIFIYYTGYLYHHYHYYYYYYYYYYTIYLWWWWIQKRKKEKKKNIGKKYAYTYIHSTEPSRKAAIIITAASLWFVSIFQSWMPNVDCKQANRPPTAV